MQKNGQNGCFPLNPQDLVTCVGDRSRFGLYLGDS